MFKIILAVNTILLVNVVLAGFFDKFSLKRWFISGSDRTWGRRRSMMMSSSKMSAPKEDSWSSSPSSPLDDIAMDDIIQDSWGSSKSSKPSCNCNCAGGGGGGGKKGGKKGKGKGSSGGGSTVAIVIPKYEFFDVPMAKEIEHESLGQVMEKGVTYKSGWGKGDSGWR